MESNESLLEEVKSFRTNVLVWTKTYDRNLRSKINQKIKKIQSIVYNAGCFKTVTISPPPAVGGLIMRNVNPFDMMFDAPYGMNVASLVIDMLDQTIGVIDSGEYSQIEEKREIIEKVMSNKKIFIVHGHDGDAKQSVARFVENLGLTPIILHERPNEGKTIIEKFEANSDVSFAIILLTPDDKGGAKSMEIKDFKYRARQNVVFELGYFIGKLGRDKVCALLKDDIERPSDYDGIVYVALDPSDGWKMLLAREMKAAGLDIDLNKTI